MTRRGVYGGGTSFAALLLLTTVGPADADAGGPRFAPAVVTYQTTATPPPLDINTLLGADAFYGRGYTGTNAVVANIEGGHFWTGHQALATNTLLLPVGGSGADRGSARVDGHATSVASAIAGRLVAANPNFKGIAYGATLWSGAIATAWTGGGSFNASDASFLVPYTTALLTGVDGRRADVVNSSFVFDDPAPSSGGTGTNVSGADSYTVALDGIARQSGRTIVFATGNTGYGPNRVRLGAGGYNTLAVGALSPLEGATGSGPYTRIAGFSSGGPSDYQGVLVSVDGQGNRTLTRQVVAQARARVDLVAPGENLRLANSGGATDAYDGPKSGTSFAAPLVAGAATLLADVGNTQYGGGFSTHATVLKAVLLNSADHDTLPGYDSGQQIVNGAVVTTQALDYARGAGRLDLAAAYGQYTGGVTDIAGALGGSGLAAVGWDYGAVGQGGFNDYRFATSLIAGTRFTATLNWHVHREFAGLTGADGVTGNLNTAPLLDANGLLISDPNDRGFVDLDLELWRLENGVPTQLAARSSADYINTERFYLTIPTTDAYLLRVVWAGERYDRNGDIASQTYGLAWSGTAAAVSAPEPGTLALLLVGVGAFARRRRRPRP